MNELSNKLTQANERIITYETSINELQTENRRLCAVNNDLQTQLNTVQARTQSGTPMEIDSSTTVSKLNSLFMEFDGKISQSMNDMVTTIENRIANDVNNC